MPLAALRKGTTTEAARAEKAPGSEFKDSKEFKGLARRVGFNARALRTAQSLTLELMAEKSGLDVAHLARIENGQTNPTLATLLRVAQGLCVSVEVLVRESDNDE